MSVLQHFEEYQKARVKFVQAVAEAATRPQNIEVMNNAGVMQLLKPLLLDNVCFKFLCKVRNMINYLLIIGNRYQVYNRLLLLRLGAWQITVKISLKLSSEMKFYLS